MKVANVMGDLKSVYNLCLAWSVTVKAYMGRKKKRREIKKCIFLCFFGRERR